MGKNRQESERICKNVQESESAPRRHRNFALSRGNAPMGAAADLRAECLKAPE
ncbi:MAG: hypothetical protein J1E58_10005 [Prevotella sp.]|nr:hypothetical protein [Prevotella sp.]